MNPVKEEPPRPRARGGALGSAKAKSNNWRVNSKSSVSLLSQANRLILGHKFLTGYLGCEASLDDRNPAFGKLLEETTTIALRFVELAFAPRNRLFTRQREDIAKLKSDFNRLRFDIGRSESHENDTGEMEL